MAEIVVRKKRSDAIDRSVVEKKFKKFKMMLEFTDRDDALNFAEVVAENNIEISRWLVDMAYR